MTVLGGPILGGMYAQKKASTAAMIEGTNPAPVGPPNMELQGPPPVGNVLADAVYKKRKRDAEVMGNPLSRLAATFGMVDGPKPLSAVEMYGDNPTAEQSMNVEIANQLTGGANYSFLNGIAGKAVSTVGGLAYKGGSAAVNAIGSLF